MFTYRIVDLWINIYRTVRVLRPDHVRPLLPRCYSFYTLYCAWCRCTATVDSFLGSTHAYKVSKRISLVNCFYYFPKLTFPTSWLHSKLLDCFEWSRISIVFVRFLLYTRTNKQHSKINNVRKMPTIIGDIWNWLSSRAIWGQAKDLTINIGSFVF